jgi:hypothetical protein
VVLPVGKQQVPLLHVPLQQSLLEERSPLAGTRQEATR